MPGESDRKEAVERMAEFILDLKKGKEMGSLEIVKRTIDIMRRLIAHSKWASPQDLLNLVREEGIKIIRADPSEGCIANMVRRVLRIIREEFTTIVEDSRREQCAAGDNGGSLLSQPSVSDLNQPCPRLKGPVIESIGELITEVESCVENIAAQALEYIHTDETVLTFGYSRTVEAFLMNAARKRKFHVIVLEGAPFCKGHILADNLSKLKIDVTLLPDTHVYAMMRKVNKVFIGTHSIMAEGGCKGPCGLYNVAQAAKDHKVPVFVCAATYKLCPDQFMSEMQPGFQKWTDPSLVFPMDSNFGDGVLDISTVVFEYVRPELINLFIFNTGPSTPATVYKLMSDTYHSDDLNLQLDDQE